SAQAQCAGQAPVMATSLEWWSMPSKDPTAIWYWYKTDTRLPWRTMRIAPTGDPAIIGGYALVNFTAFERVPQTNLSELRDFCAARAVQPKVGRPSALAKSARALKIAASDRASEAERKTAISRLIPGLEYQACANATHSHWPPRFEMTAIMLSTD